MFFLNILTHPEYAIFTTLLRNVPSIGSIRSGSQIRRPVNVTFPKEDVNLVTEKLTGVKLEFVARMFRGYFQNSLSDLITIMPTKGIVFILPRTGPFFIFIFCSYRLQYSV